MPPPSGVMGMVCVAFSNVYSRMTERTPTRSVTVTLISVGSPTTALRTGASMEISGGSRSIVTFFVFMTALL